MKRKIFLVAFALIVALVLTGCAQSILPGTTWYTGDASSATITFNRDGTMTYTANIGPILSLTGGSWYANNNVLTLAGDGTVIKFNGTYNVKISGRNMNFYDNGGFFLFSWYKR